MRFLPIAGLLGACFCVVPGAIALPIGIQASTAVAAPASQQDNSPAPKPAQTQNIPRTDDPGEVEVNPKLPQGVPPATPTTPEDTPTPAASPSSPAAADAEELPPLPKVYKPVEPIRHIGSAGSTYVPMDSWMYPALDRLSSLGYLDTAFFGQRPWTRLSIANMLEATAAKLGEDSEDQTARQIFNSLQRELLPDLNSPSVNAQVESVYGNFLPIGGTPLTDSFHFGQTDINDYGRPYAQGFNMQLGGSARAEAGRFTLYFRGEYQHAPSLRAQPLNVQQATSAADSQIGLPNSFALKTRNDLRLLNASVGYHLWGTEISVGKSDMWWGPAQGGAMSYSINAEPIYMLRVNRVEPLYIPGFSRVFGPVRLDGFFGDFKGHRSPNNPWVLGNKISLHPTPNIEFGFSRQVMFAGKGYTPLTFRSFWRAFACICDAYNAGGRQYDVGNRLGNFDFRWRLPGVSKTVTIYADSNGDDDPSPLANFRRSSWRPGIYLSHVPGVPKLDFRFEAPYSNQPHDAGITYTNHAYKDGYTNKSFLVADWIGRDSTGYQSWLTYWINPQEQVQAQYRDSKLDTGLWVGGGTQTDVSVRLVKRLSDDLEMKTSVQYERWWIPLLNAKKQSDVSGRFEITWYPRLGTAR